MRNRGVELVVIIGICCLVAGIVEAGTTLRLGHTDPPDGLRHKSALLFADKVKEYTQGRYSVDAHHSSTLGDDPKLLEQVKLGAIDFAVTGVGIYSNQVPELGLLALPAAPGRALAGQSRAARAHRREPPPRAGGGAPLLRPELQHLRERRRGHGGIVHFKGSRYFLASGRMADGGGPAQHAV